jgi:hypothetical protein
VRVPDQATRACLEIYVGQRHLLGGRRDFP